MSFGNSHKVCFVIHVWVRYAALEYEEGRFLVTLMLAQDLLRKYAYSINVSFESTLSKQQYATKITSAELGGKQLW